MADNIDVILNAGRDAIALTRCYLNDQSDTATAVTRGIGSAETDLRSGRDI